MFRPAKARSLNSRLISSLTTIFLAIDAVSTKVKKVQLFGYSSVASLVTIFIVILILLACGYKDFDYSGPGASILLALAILLSLAFCFLNLFFCIVFSMCFDTKIAPKAR